MKNKAGIIGIIITVIILIIVVILSNISKSALAEIEEEVTSAMLELKDEN